MAIISATAGAVVGGRQIAKSLGIKVPKLGIFGGSSEAGSGTTRAGTLAHAIDKMDKANDIEAIRASRAVVSAINSGVRDKTKLEAIIANDIGYRPGDILRSRKWSYISQMIDKEFQKANNAKTIQDQNSQKIFGSPIGGPSVNVAGFNPAQVVLIVGALFGLYFYTK